MLEQRLAIILRQYAEKLKEYRAVPDPKIPEIAEVTVALDDLVAFLEEQVRLLDEEDKGTRGGDRPPSCELK